MAHGARSGALRRLLRPGRPRDLRQAALPGRHDHRRPGLARPAGGRLRAAGDRVLPGHPRVAARHAGARLRAGADFIVRGLRADVDPALLPDRLPQA
jgi:hypothetical protein